MPDIVVAHCGLNKKERKEKRKKERRKEGKKERRKEREKERKKERKNTFAFSCLQRGFCVFVVKLYGYIARRRHPYIESPEKFRYSTQMFGNTMCICSLYTATMMCLVQTKF